MATTLTATMRAVAVTPKQPGSARQVELPIPTTARGSALMRVLEVGIDGTDTEINEGLYGEPPPGANFLVIGHEALSVVEAVGEGVSGFTRGDLVVSTVRRPDNCPNCQAGESDMCLFGAYTERGIKGAHGYMGEYYSETPAFMVKIPPALRPFAVLLEPLSIVEKATFQAWKIQERMVWRPARAVVLGAGPIGILGTILLRLRGLEVHVYAKSAPDSLQGRILTELVVEALAREVGGLVLEEERHLHLLRPARHDLAEVAGHAQEGAQHEQAHRDGAHGQRVDEAAPPEAGEGLLEEVREGPQQGHGRRRL